ncbi:glutamate-rich WD repeat-containing protein 1 [Phtheirospermum japonicum]|uniref:Glutamate-rich WD repeat-containing protein 1 n=1 Tax=Phtheirospermum japonicum TaxID=374723 RepID=A0A830D3B0_9LAMI|nr:glutamate-rich WD repeat-containing protein 1 [Phtheirospermum japonicum]
MGADKGKKQKVGEPKEKKNGTEHIDGELVLSIERLQEIQDDLEKVQWIWKREAPQTTKRVIVKKIAEEFKLTGDGVYEEFTNSCFGFLLGFDAQGSCCGTALHCLFTHEVIKADAGPDELWYRVGGRLIRFSKYEYALVTGLSFGPTTFVPSAEHHPPASGLFLQYYRGQILTMDALRSDFTDGVFRESPADALKMSKLLIVYFLLFGKDDKQSYIDKWAWTLIEDSDGFDILHDSLGLVRTEFPHTAYCVAGTQGSFESDSDSSDSDEDDEEDGAGSSPVLQVWDLNSHLKALAESEAEAGHGGSTVFNQAPIVKFVGHKDEGYAIDWSPLVAGRLMSRDCKNCIHLWELASDSSWNIDPNPFIGHTTSVEDLQWSPTEPFVFASCSVDGNIAIWDIRVGKSPAVSIKAHKADINVITWNSLASCMLASGSDDGTFSIRDLRLLKEGDAVVAHFDYHKHPITSIEWSPHEASTLTVTSSDNQLTVWDLSLEMDEEEEAEFKAKTKEQVNALSDLPPQLLFVHQGQKDLKELHWHSQIPGMIISTAADGYNILMPSNIETALPANNA